MATTNTIIETLNKFGYLNEGTNRESAIRNLNLLLDSGVMKIELIEADIYNAKEDGKSFWYTGQDGKKYCTPYKVTLFGKRFFGHFVQKSKTTKFKHIQHMDGTWEYVTNTDYYNNYKLDLSEILLRVAQLISIIRGNGDFLQSEIFSKYGKCSCNKCNGVGIIPAFSYYANGICFDCCGIGVDRNTLKMYISESINSATKK